MNIPTLIDRVQDWGRRWVNGWRHGVPFALARNIDVPGKKIMLSEGDVTVRAPDEQGVKSDFVGIFLDDCYGLYSADLPDAPSILDIGANIGLFALAARQVYPESTIHCYEPNPRLEGYLDHHSAEADFTYHMEAVGPSDGKTTLLLEGDSNQARTGEGGKRTVPIRSFGKAVRRLDQPVDLLKLDCEGSEWTLFDEVEEWENIRRIAMEYHLWATEGMDHRDVKRKLKDLGYTVVKQPENPDRSYAHLWAKRN